MLISPCQIKFHQSSKDSNILELNQHTILINYLVHTIKLGKQQCNQRYLLLYLLQNDTIHPSHSNASYLVAPYAKSRIDGYFFLPSDPTKPTPHNNPFHIECKTLRHVVTSSAEWETAAVFHNAQTAIHIRYMLQQLGHSQPPTPIILDNSITENFIKNNITQERSTFWDIKYYWPRDNHIQRIFDFIWKQSQLNLAHHCIKHFPAVYYRQMRKNMFLIFIKNISSYVASLVEGVCQYNILFATTSATWKHIMFPHFICKLFFLLS